ncbi:large subunit GTPase 1 homolog isoform X1 [Hydra vulgaris]|uniref:large subunit GTPase 1 homolog isoform X1 n=1 Tax=Hydra vulgaris TaxID=6087 RepID=UPI001F5EFE85|nr:large subunit GTPase 1 homolog [Hydra vulgaris]
MGKKKNSKNADLGRALIKEKNTERRGHGLKATSWLHSSDLHDGYDWNRLNLQSVTEQNTLEEFLETAEMAGVEFKAEKLNVKIVGTGSATGVLGDSEKCRIKKLQEENCKFVTIPRRPHWDETTSPEQLALMERETFLNWRRSLSLLQEEKGLLLTPYEKNLDIWRQLWRVIERSDVICQIVDARNPLLYKTDDLETYVKEVNPSKKFIILVNKADYLTKKQRSYWLNYFKMINTKVIFWSALEEIELKVTKSNTDDLPEDYNEKPSSSEIIFENNNSKIDDIDKKDSNTLCYRSSILEDSEDLFRTSQLISYFKTFEKVVRGPHSNHDSYITIGLVGYPNVGKSSTINALLREKKTAVSATPGKTKHFQTHFLDESLCLCDCPGLVFPSFISSKAEMVLNGILPIDQLRDHVSPTNILCQLIPRVIIENIYGINIPKPGEGEDLNRPPTAEELLSTYGRMRGFMTANGQPDCPRTSRYVLKDFIKGKLLYCHPPPDVSNEDYEPCVMSEKVRQKIILREERNKKLRGKEQVQCVNHVDEDFFSEKTPGFGFKAPTSLLPNVNNGQYLAVNKPWKKHGNKNKKEKLRRIHDK